eukprot:6200669-Pleurochrysis_carterae.AAC.1
MLRGVHHHQADAAAAQFVGILRSWWTLRVDWWTVMLHQITAMQLQLQLMVVLVTTMEKRQQQHQTMVEQRTLVVWNTLHQNVEKHWTLRGVVVQLLL